MAKTVILTCDVHADGTPALKSIEIQVGRRRWSADICQEHEDALLAAVAPFVPKTVKVAKSAAPSADDPAARARRDAVRVWAAKAGVPLPQRGRIPTSAYEGYDAAMAAKADAKTEAAEKRAAAKAETPAKAVAKKAPAKKSPVKKAAAKKAAAKK
jgi:hypothetical protein